MSRILRRGTLCLIGLVLGGSAAFAQTTVYWDVNGATTGSGGPTPSGTWNTSGAANWNSVAGGTGAVASWVSGNDAVFSAGTDATGSYTVTLGANMNVGNLTFEEGAATISGNTLTFNRVGGSTVNVASGLTAVIDSNVAGSVNMTKSGTGTLTLTGSNSYTGTTAITAGTINIRDATALGTTAAGTVVASGAALEIQNNITVGSETLSLAGTGVGSNGALRNVADANTWAGNITLTAASEIKSDAGSLAVSGNVTSANFGLTFDGAGDTSISGVVGLGSGSLTKNGTGTLTLSGANTYTGVTRINDGTISINSIKNVSGGASSLGAPTTTANGTIAIGSGATGATLAYTGAAASTNRVINLAGTTGGATLDASGTGALTFTSAFTATGAGSKTLTLTGSSAAANTISGAIVNNSGANITSLVKDGAGTWVLSGANTFTGTTTINGGVLRINADTRLGTAPGVATANKLVIDGGALEATASFTLSANRGTTIGANGGTFDVNSGRTLTFSGILAGTGTLTKSDVGTLVLGGATTNTHSGDVEITGGTLRIAKTVANTGIGDSANVTVASGASLVFSGGVAETIGSLAGAGTVDNTNAAAVTITTGGNGASTDYSGVLQDTGGALSIVKTGTGTQTLSGTAANTYAGTTAVTSGTLNLNKTAGVNAVGSGAITVGDGSGAAGSASLVLLASNQLPDASLVTLNSDGRLALNDFSETIDRVAGTGLIDLATSGYLNVGSANGSSSFSGTIAGTGTLEKSGTGTLTFNSTISFGGTLTLSGGTLALNGTSLTVGTLHITGNTVLDFGNATSSTLNATNFLVDGGVTLSITNWVDLTDHFITQGWTGATPDTSGTTPMNQITFSGNSASDTHWQSYDNQVTPVPEPAAYGAAFVGLAVGWALWRRRRSLISRSR